MPYRSDENGRMVHYDDRPGDTLPPLRAKDQYPKSDPHVVGYAGYGDVYQQSLRPDRLRVLATVAVRLFREWSELDCHPDLLPDHIVALYDLREKLGEAMLDLEGELVR